MKETAVSSVAQCLMPSYTLMRVIAVVEMMSMKTCRQAVTMPSGRELRMFLTVVQQLHSKGSRSMT